MQSRLLHALAGVVVLVTASPALSQGNPPLTRSEPIVRMVLQEANTEPFLGKVAVAGVALDRVADPRWPSNVRAVVYQPWQFTGMMSKLGDYTNKDITQARLAVYLAKKGVRPCGKSLWYHAIDIPKPAWTKGLKRTCMIGDHVFYTDGD